MPRKFLYLGWFALVTVFYYTAHWPRGADFHALGVLLQWPTLTALGLSLRRVLLSLWIVLLCAGLGRVLLRRCGLRFVSTLEGGMFAAGLGSGVLVLSLIVLAVLGLYSSHALLGLFLLATLGIALANRDLYVSRRWPSFSLPVLSASEKCLSILLIAHGMFYGLHALAPEISYDALTYHLALPQQWLLAHRLFATPSYCFSGLPLNMELLYGLALAMGDSIVAKLLHFWAGVGTLGVIYLLARRLGGSRHGGLAASLVFLAPPMVTLEFVRAGIDLGTTFFTLLAGSAWVIGEDSDETHRRRWQILCAIFCGLAMGTKYTAWIFLPVLVLISGNLWLAAPALLLILPWILRNIAYFHNPVYPLLGFVFPTPASTLSNWPALHAEAGRTLGEFARSGAVWIRYLIEPWTASMGTTSGGNYLGPVYLLFFPCLFFIPKSRPSKTVLWIFLGLWIPLSLLSWYPRFWLPALAYLAVLIGVGMSGGLRPRWLQRTALLLLGGVSIFNLVLSHVALLRTTGWQVVWGKQTAEDYLSRPHAEYHSPYYRAADFINRTTAPQSRVLLLGDPRGFYLQRLYTGASLFDTHPLIRWANASANGDDLYERLRQIGFTHILLNAAEASRMQSYQKETFTTAGKKTFDAFWQAHVQNVFTDQDLSEGELRSTMVYALVDRQR